MSGLDAFLILICIGLALWALMRTFSLEASLRERIRQLEQRGNFVPPRPAAAAPRPVDPESRVTILEAAKAVEPPAGAPPAAPATIQVQAQSQVQTPTQVQAQAKRLPETAVTRPMTAGKPAPTGARELLAFITGGNIFVRIGVLVLFFGVAFLLKYASEHHALPPQVRLAGAALLAIILLVVGWRLRQRLPGYALVLQGGGIGVLYLAVFASLRLYQLLPAPTVFLWLCAIAVFSAVLAVLQDSVWLAVMGVLGGFLAPVLASTGDGSHVVLFSYYLVLNAGIVAIAFYRSWRILNVLGFICTFIIGSAWGALRYKPELFATTEPFLAAFFLMYTGVALLYAKRQSLRLTHYADGTLIFGVPLVGFGLQSAMVHQWEYALAFSALALALFYMLLASLVQRWKGRELRLLTEAFLALGVGFGTLAIPFALNAYWTSAAWALEGAGIAWTGLRQQRRLLVFSGLLLQIAGGIAFLFQDRAWTEPLMPVLNSQTLGILLIAAAGLFSSWQLEGVARGPEAPLKQWSGPFSLLMYVWGMLWWAHGGLEETARLTRGDNLAHLNALLLFISASAAIFSLAARGLRWRLLGFAPLILAPVSAIALCAAAMIAPHPSQDWGWLAWAVTLVVAYPLLRGLEDDDEIRSLLPAWHAVTALVSIAVISWECNWQAQWPHDVLWHPPLAGALPALALLALATQAKKWLPWPMGRYPQAYVGWTAAALAAYLWLWILASNLSADSSQAMFPYVPLLNPLDAALFLAVLALGFWVLALYRERASFPAADALQFIPGIPGLALFICINGMLIRALCYWLRLPFDWDRLVDSQIVQMCVSILWTLCALGLMVCAARLRLRAVWFSGAVLMAVEIIKLFAVDLASAGSLERIVSFIVVGGLLLLVGYFSPLPPSVAAEG